MKKRKKTEKKLWGIHIDDKKRIKTEKNLWGMHSDEKEDKIEKKNTNVNKVAKYYKQSVKAKTLTFYVSMNTSR